VSPRFVVTTSIPKARRARCGCLGPEGTPHYGTHRLWPIGREELAQDVCDRRYLEVLAKLLCDDD